MSRSVTDSSRKGGLQQGHGVVIAHQSPSVRMSLAMGLIDDHPVFMANGPEAMLYQLGRAAAGWVRAPSAVFVGEPELSALSESEVWESLSTLPILLVLVAPNASSARGAHAVVPPRAGREELQRLLAA